MKDKELNEKESLELIIRMIRNTRQTWIRSSGNDFFADMESCDFGCMGRCHVYG